MRRALKVSLVLVLLVFMAGCAQSTWQSKGTAIYVGAGKTIKAADDSFLSLKAANMVTVQQTAQYDTVYKDVYTSYEAAGTGWKLALRAGNDVEQKKYLDAFNKNFAEFQKFLGDMVILVNGLLAKGGN